MSFVYTSSARMCSLPPNSEETTPAIFGSPSNGRPFKVAFLSLSSHSRTAPAATRHRGLNSILFYGCFSTRDSAFSPSLILPGEFRLCDRPVHAVSLGAFPVTSLPFCARSYFLCLSESPSFFYRTMAYPSPSPTTTPRTDWSGWGISLPPLPPFPGD